MNKPNTPQELIIHPLCSGCMACTAICPVGALKKSQDINGFYRPSFDENECTNCGMCTNLCPVHNPEYKNSKSPDCYAFMADDETRMGSSSGGAFPVLARNFLRRGAKVVGAAWTKDFEVKLILISKESDIIKLQGSKYVQSDASEIYDEVKRELKAGSEILFTGLPCQVAGLYATLDKSYLNLFTVNILCANSPSPGLFKKYLDETFGKTKVQDYLFRAKEGGWGYTIKVNLKNGEVKLISPKHYDSWREAFSTRIMYREICQNCPFGVLPCQGDITIGDFWGIGEHDKTLDDKLGTSCILANNSKGNDLIKFLDKESFKLKKTPLEWLVSKNRLRGREWASPYVKRFYSLAKQIPFSHTVEYVKNNKYDVGIITVWSSANYGGALTAYALWQAVEDMGYTAICIERPKTSTWRSPSNVPLFKVNPFPSWALEKFYNDKFEMRKHLTTRCDRFLVGSDQLFETNIYNNFDKYTSLDWVWDYQKKAAYSTSFGYDGEHMPAEQTSFGHMSLFLKKFDYFAVREKSNVALVKNSFEIESRWVLDPVFLLNRDVFDEFADRGSDFFTPGSLLSIIYFDHHLKSDILKHISIDLNKSISYIQDMRVELQKDKKIYCEDWLRSIQTSKLLITDSFHAMCFALIFNRPFLVLPQRIKSIGRFKTVLEPLGLLDRIIHNIEDYEKIKDTILFFDWNLVNGLLQNEVKRSKDELAKAIAPLKSPKTTTEYDLLMCENIRLWEELYSAKKRIEALETLKSPRVG